MTTRVSLARLLPAVVVLGTLTLAGCAFGEFADGVTSSAPSASAEPGTGSPDSMSASATADPAESSEPAPSGSPSMSPTAEPADGMCSADMLDAVLETEMGGGAAGSVYRQIIFTNASDEECRISGYPGVSYVDASGEQIGAAADREPGESAQVVLAPGEMAVAPVKQTNADTYGTECEPTEVVGLRVYPPGDTASLIVDQVGMACASEDVVLMTVAPVRPLAP